MSTTTTTAKPQSRVAGLKALETLRPFIGEVQRRTLASMMRGEERQFFIDKLIDLAARVSSMPTTYEQDGLGDEAIAFLHYFAGGCASWWITEKDKGSPDDPQPGQQLQAFGLADLFMDGGEVGYISIAEILENGGELDLYFSPKPLSWVREQRRASR